MTVQSWEEMTRARLIKSVAHVVKGLRQVADEVEVEAARNIQRVSEIEGEDYAYVAEQVIRSVTWGNANLNMSNVVDAAADATAARKEKKRATPALDAPVVDALDELAHIATLWAEQSAENDREMDRRDPRPAERQVFVLADIIHMIGNARQIVASKQGAK